MEEMATRSSILAWEIPWTEQPSGLHGVAKSGHDRAAARAQSCDWLGFSHLQNEEQMIFKGLKVLSCLRKKRYGGLVIRL